MKGCHQKSCCNVKISGNFHSRTSILIIFSVGGGLMHIPDLEKAISELSRVLKSGGFLIISENNSKALEIPVIRVMQSLWKRPTISKVITFGIENWTSGSDKTLFCRSTNINWLINSLNKEKMVVVSHVLR